MSLSVSRKRSLRFLSFAVMVRSIIETRGGSRISTQCDDQGSVRRTVGQARFSVSLESVAMPRWHLGIPFSQRKHRLAFLRNETGGGWRMVGALGPRRNDFSARQFGDGAAFPTVETRYG